jgi:hypothetical protein
MRFACLNLAAAGGSAATNAAFVFGSLVTSAASLRMRTYNDLFLIPPGCPVTESTL